MNRIIHFEIQADDPERAVKFYKEVFGWEINEWVVPDVEMKDENRYWMVTTGPETEPGINGTSCSAGLRLSGQPVNAYVCTTGALTRTSMSTKCSSQRKHRTPKMAKGIGWLAYCKDTEKTSSA
jgi:predicted enzyme related to lactoylglutathione lyase